MWSKFKEEIFHTLLNYSIAHSLPEEIEFMQIEKFTVNSLKLLTQYWRSLGSSRRWFPVNNNDSNGSRMCEQNVCFKNRKWILSLNWRNDSNHAEQILRLRVKFVRIFFLAWHRKSPIGESEIKLSSSDLKIPSRQLVDVSLTKKLETSLKVDWKLR